MSVDLQQTLTATEGVIKAIGDTAQAALQVGNVVLPILQDIGLIVPPAGIAANYVAVALPYIRAVATYAPQVNTALAQGVPMIQAAVGVGDALLSPLTSLMSAIPELVALHDFFGSLDAFLKANEFTPQDPRFSQAEGSPQ